MSNRSQRRWILLAAATLAAPGCASHDRWIDCESHLVPINAPAPLVHDQGASPADGKAQVSSGHDR